MREYVCSIGIINILYKLEKKIFLVSGSDENELIYVFKKRKLFYLFDKIYGSPKSKFLNFELLLKNSNNKNKCIYFGDSKLDYEVSKEFNMDFIYVSEYSEWKKGKSILNSNNIIRNFEAIKY